MRVAGDEEAPMNLIPIEAMLARRLSKASKEDLVQMSIGFGQYSDVLLRSRTTEQLRDYVAKKLAERVSGRISEGPRPLTGGSGAASDPQGQPSADRPRMMTEAEMMSLRMSIGSLVKELEARRSCALEQNDLGGCSPEVRDVEPELTHRLKRLGILEYDLGLDEAASASFRRALGFAGSDSEKAFLLVGIGLTCERLCDYSGAQEAYAGALALRSAPEEPRYWANNNLAYCLNVTGRCAEAEPYCRAALAIDPNRHNAHKNLGLSLQGQGKLVQAALSFVRAAQMYPADVRALSHLECLVRDNPVLLAERPDLREGLDLCRRLAGRGAERGNDR